MRKEQLAINSVSTRHSGLEAALEAYAKAGFTNVEFVLPLVKDWIREGRSIEDARALLRAHDMRPIGGFQTHVECFTAPESMQHNHDLHLENARLIHALGGGTLVVGTDGPSAARADALDVIAENFHGLAERIKNMDVAIAIEFNWSPVVKSLHSALLVAEAVNHAQVGILFDPAHFYTTVTKFEHLTARSMRWIRHVHLDDMRDKPGDLSNCNSDRVLPGEGILDVRAIIDRLELHGYQGFFSIEMFNEDLWKMSVTEAAQRCYESLIPYCVD
ncbi:MAG: sugar phosphate isomerase/epimerase [Chloroflexi bacterium]|nr:sugar phosphate isomerase/epimerase [Chloroflexota bacterium]